MGHDLLVVSDTRLKDAFNLTEQHIESRYGVEVNISDVADPNTGDFDGQRIKIDYALDLEVALFVLLHLFGHTVQWNISARHRVLGQNQGMQKSEDELREIFDYELEATRYSIQLMHEAGIFDLDQWASDWWVADWKYLEHLYRTGKKLDVKGLYQLGSTKVLSPMEIPEFVPQKWASRWSF